MAEGRFAQIVILAEDNVQARFIRRWLVGWIKNPSPHAIHEVPRPTGKGSGEQFVRTQFSIEAEKHRLKVHNRGSMLIAVIDADTREFIERHRELMEQSVEKRNVFVFVPKRNIETWLHELTGNSATENDDYKAIYAKDAGPAITAAAQEFLERIVSPSKSTQAFVPSLAFGIKTAREIPRSHEPVDR